MLATCSEARVHDAPKAIRYALRACRRSDWNCWAFVGTLAAAYARAGDFPRAIGWQRASLGITPLEHRPEGRRRFALFEAGQACTDRFEGKVAAGEEVKPGRGEDLPAEFLLHLASGYRWGIDLRGRGDPAMR